MINIEHIKRFVEGHRRREISKPNLKKAAVLMLFYPKGNNLYVLLTRRTEDVEHHKGQISFPGGSQDEEDGDLIGTALRESEEEIGLERDNVEVLGVFDDFEIPTGFAVTPVIAYAQSLPRLSPNAIEVAEILEVPVELFLHKENERVEHRVWGGVLYDVFFYRFGENEIWGATAAILRAFLLSLRDAASDH